MNMIASISNGPEAEDDLNFAKQVPEPRVPLTRMRQSLEQFVGKSVEDRKRK